MTSDENARAPDREAGVREGVRDMIVAALLLGATGVFWWDSLAISASEARMFPRMVLIVLGLLSLLLFVRGLRMKPLLAEMPVISSAPAFAAFIGTAILYVVAVGSFGFFTSSVVYIPLAAWLIGLRKLWLNALVTALFLLATWLVFVGLFARPLPAELFWN